MEIVFLVSLSGACFYEQSQWKHTVCLREQRGAAGAVRVALLSYMMGLIWMVDVPLQTYVFSSRWIHMRYSREGVWVGSRVFEVALFHRYLYMYRSKGWHFRISTFYLKLVLIKLKMSCLVSLSGMYALSIAKFPSESALCPFYAQPVTPQIKFIFSSYLLCALPIISAA